MTEELKNKKVLTLNEILEGLSELATNGEGAQRSQAYRMLLGQGGSQVTLPDPIEQTEIVQKLGRLMKPAGSRLCQLAFKEAFGIRKQVNEAVEVYAEDLDLQGVKLATTLRALYKTFPEIKKGGFPKGYPAGRSLEAKAEWCKQEHKKMLLDRKRKELNPDPPEPEVPHVPEPSWFRQKAKDAPTESGT